MGRFWKTITKSCKYLGASLAIVLVRRKVQRRPHDWGLWLMLSRLYEIGGQWQQALEALEEARKISPENRVISQRLIRVRQAANRDSEDDTEGKG